MLFYFYLEQVTGLALVFPVRMLRAFFLVMFRFFRYALLTRLARDFRSDPLAFGELFSPASRPATSLRFSTSGIRPYRIATNTESHSKVTFVLLFANVCFAHRHGTSRASGTFGNDRTDIYSDFSFVSYSCARISHIPASCEWSSGKIPGRNMTIYSYA